jgi:hypothetical protein
LFTFVDVDVPVVWLACAGAAAASAAGCASLIAEVEVLRCPMEDLSLVVFYRDENPSNCGDGAVVGLSSIRVAHSNVVANS